MEFRLSEVTKRYLAKSSKQAGKNTKSKVDLNSQKFYKQHPDLAPRDIYLASGRVIKKETVDKYLDNIGKKSLFEKVCDFIKNIRRN